MEKILQRHSWWLLGLLISVHAFTAAYDSGPDESDHFEAARYYQTKWLPPQVGSIESLPSYSRYGYSYLNHPDWVYRAAGKSLMLAEACGVNAFWIIRSVNVVAAWILLLGLSRSERGRRVLPILFICPEVLYIFTYFNSDAWALTTCVLAGGLTVARADWWQQRPQATRLLLCGGLWALAISTKMNYLLVPGLVGLWYALHLHMWSGLSRLYAWYNGVILVVLGVSLWMARFGYERMVNGWNYAAEVKAMIPALAAPAYQLHNQGLPGAWEGLGLLERGVVWKEIFIDNAWLWRLARDAAGQFGYHQWYYISGLNELLAWALPAFWFLTYCVIVRSITWRPLLGWACCWPLLLVLNLSAALYFGLKIDFQPQFRYLFPALASLCVLAMAVHQNWPRILERCGSIGLLVSAIYFCVAALVAMPKERTYQMERDPRYFDNPNPALRESRELFDARRGKTGKPPASQSGFMPSQNETNSSGSGDSTQTSSP
ncbi:MAG: hypothetical protein ACFCUX_06720 [Candidatus Methylacidiphilales bacterium]